MTVFDDNTVAVENIVAEFESTWTADSPHRIQRYLPPDSDQELWRRSLWELVEADLELRIKANQEARVEDYLDEFPALLDEQSRFVQFVYSEYRLRARRELNLTTDSYFERFPILIDPLKALFDRAPSRGYSSTDVKAEQSNGSSSDRIGAPTSKSGRFRLLEPHEEGGLGKVWVAYDCELDREVALKEIKPQYADDETSRLRFATEAMVTSSLEHPGIVPVYGFGQYKDGRPYYTMRFVRGSSFRDAIREFHDADWATQTAGARSVEMRRLLSHFLDVCNTIHYAHQRAVLHRDLKPGNIMLGDYGETLVVDWGLAKTLGESENPTLESQPDLQLALEKFRSDAVATRLGKALGSPAYMSPEQARGEHDKLGPATDVYSLGATLYTLLTNERPIRKGEQTEELLESVKKGDWPRPRSIRASIPAALEAICLKAMGLEPADRYNSARELGADIERYLADQPVTAMRENLFQGVSRFMRRNDALVRAIAIALVTVAATSFIAAISIDEQRRISEDVTGQLSAYQRSAVKNRAETQKRHARAERLSIAAFALREGDESGEDVSLIDALDQAVEEIDGSANERGLTQIEFAEVYSKLRAFTKAAKWAESGAALLTESLGEAEPETLDALAVHASVLEASGDLESSRLVRQDAITRLAKTNDEPTTQLVELQLSHARWLADHEFYDEALSTQQSACDVLTRWYGLQDARVLAARIQLANLLHANGRTSKAESMLQEVTTVCDQKLGPANSLTLSALNAFSAIRAEKLKGARQTQNDEETKGDGETKGEKISQESSPDL